MFSKIAAYRVLVVGDAITDEYRYVVPIGKGNKEPIISVRFEKRHSFSGGTEAAANHLRTMVETVDVLTGQWRMVNIRYVEETYMRKLFGVHEVIANKFQAPNFDAADYDLVIVTDFGHGTMTQEMIAKVSKARFLAVNAQTNSQNYGFNLISKYKRADFVVLDELEARLAAGDQHSPIEDVILALGFKKIIVTMGSQGAVGFDGAFERQTAKSTKVLDTMGAGDAFLAIAAPFAAAGCSMRELVRIGNAAGAAKVKIAGHSRYITRVDVEAELV